ncbi:carboxymuconolactone decarboxylase family protein [Aquincola sp. MAHUQ-54]|uniref:Carboxymuconolactone decarboxylase family protein n=1 Tax=Aquincola agrisoli TaxID=3119538 RepID=A0AAW9QET4_9BURK
MRIAPIPPGTRPDLAELEAGITAQRGRVSPLYQVLLNSPPMAQGWERMLTAVRRHNTLPEDVRELVIVRVAVLNRARFEYDAHVPIALAAGATQAKIDALADPATIGPGLTAAEQALIRLTDTMTRDIEVPQALYDEVRRHCDERQVVDALVTIGAYNMVSRFLVALQIGH